MLIPHRHYLLILAALFALWWVALAIHPLHRNIWLLENALNIAGVVLLAVSPLGEDELPRMARKRK